MKERFSVARFRRILLECSGTFESSANTGIQRVVRNIVKGAEQIGKELNIKCQPVIVKNGSCFSIAPDKKPFLIRFRAFLWTLLRAKTSELRSNLRSYLIFRKIESFLSPLVRKLRIFAVINFFFDILTLPMVLNLYLWHIICVGKDDIILLLDSSWAYPIWPAVKKAKNNGATVGLVVYDLIQITHRDFFSPAITQRFTIWFEEAIKHVDFFIGISKTVQTEIQKYLQQNHPHYLIDDRLGSFLLGCDLDNISKNGLVRSELEDICKRGNYLTVGTIEPRKNHKYLLDAFDLIWQQSPDTVLCVIGKIGWKCEGVVNRIKKHPLLKKNLFMFNNLSDAELNYCYKHSKGLIFPSLAEGFGLPIVESLHHGLPVFVSDIPIHREVGKAFCTYFDISVPSCLAKIVIDIEKTGKMPQVRSCKEHNLTTWKDSCRELLSKAIALSEKV